MIREYFTSLNGEQLRSRRDAVVRDARERIGRARGEVEVARREGALRLWTWETEALTLAHERLGGVSERLEPVVDPLRRAVDHRLEAVVRVPVEGYDAMNARTAADAVRSLDLVDLARVERHERAHKDRKTVLAAIERVRERLLREPVADA